MKLEILKSNLGDNFFYFISDEEGRAALIDPVDGELAVERVRAGGYELTHVINTHFHPDHVSGNPRVLEAFPNARVVAGEGDAEAIDAQFVPRGERGVDERVNGGDVVNVGSLRLEVLDTPGHTEGHISLRQGDHLFSGDTVFVAGAGNCRFGGDPGTLFETFRDVLRELPESTVFYPGHDYSIRNAEFLLSIEPEHSETPVVLEEAKAAAEEGRLMTSTLGRERRYNAFFRFDDPELLQALQSRYGEELERARRQSESEHEAVFRCVRELRNRW